MKKWIFRLLLLAAVGLALYGGARYLYLRAYYPYPEEFAPLVAEQAEKNGLEESFVLGVIRSESSFRPTVVSSAGAVGLMQITPDTFDFINQKGGFGFESAEQLSDPVVNVTLGCYHLAYLIERFGAVEEALCAYNAGIARVDGWLDDAAYSSDGKSLHTIPYPETAAYVERVKTAQAAYERLYELFGS